MPCFIFLQMYFRLHTIVHLDAFADSPCDRKHNLPHWRHTVAPAGCCSALSVHHQIAPAHLLLLIETFGRVHFRRRI